MQNLPNKLEFSQQISKRIMIHPSMSGIWYGLKLKDIEDVDSNNVRKFITEKTEENGDSFIEIKYLYNEYEKWIVDSDIKEDKIDLQSFVNNGGLDVANGIVLELR